MLLDEAGEPLRSESLNRRKTAYSARLPQISPISLISLLYATSLYAFFQQGFVSGTTFVAVAAIALALVGMFYGAFRSGLNARFRDQTLMLPQIVASLLMMLCVAWIERDTQVALVPFILIAFSFGIFRLSTLSLIALAVGCLMAYLGIILLRYHEHGHGFALRADMMQWFVLALTLPGMILVGKQIQIRLTPTLEFIADAIPETAAHLEDLLREAKERDAAVAAAAAGATYAGDADPYKRDEDELEDGLDDDDLEGDDLEAADDEPVGERGDGADARA